MKKLVWLVLIIGCAHGATKSDPAVEHHDLPDWDLSVTLPVQTTSEEGDLLLGTNVDHPERAGWAFRIDIGQACSDSAADAERCAADDCRKDGKCGLVGQASDTTLLGLPAKAHRLNRDVNAGEELFAVLGACKIRLSVWVASKDQLDAQAQRILKGIATKNGAPLDLSVCHAK